MVGRLVGARKLQFSCVGVSDARSAAPTNASLSRMEHSLSRIPAERRDAGFFVGNMIPAVIDDGSNDGLIPGKDKICLPGLCTEAEHCPGDWSCVEFETGSVIGYCSSGSVGPDLDELVAPQPVGHRAVGKLDIHHGAVAVIAHTDNPAEVGTDRFCGLEFTMLQFAADRAAQLTYKQDMPPGKVIRVFPFVLQPEPMPLG